MRILLFLPLLFLLSPPHATAAESAADDYGFPYYCPLYVVYEFSPTYFLYFCEKFPSSCTDIPAGDYWVGDLPNIPYQNCGTNDCGEGSFKDDAKVALAAAAPPKSNHPSPFPGLKTKVPLDYMHDRDVGNGIPGSTVGTGVNRERNCHFVKFKDDARKVRYAKVIEVRFNRKVSRRGGATDQELAGQWVSKFMAFEVTVTPADEDFEVHNVMAAEKLHPNDTHVYRGLIAIDNTIGKAVNVLVFLAK